MTPDRRSSPRTAFRARRRTNERITALGVEMDLVRPEEVMHHVEAHVRARQSYCVANYNAHGVYLARKNADFARFCATADLIEVDSTPIILFTRMLGLHARTFHRCTYLDWRDHFWSLANRHKWRVFYLGGAPGVAARAAENLAETYPGAIIETRDGYFDATPGSPENAAVIEQIKAFEPHVVFVGMGMPRQEAWLLHNTAQLPPCVTFSVGAAFDYEAGVQSAAPRWMGRMGFEWLYRLVADPKRLFHRYCIEPWGLMGAVVSDVRVAIRDRRLFKGPKPAPQKAGPVQVQAG